MIPLHRSHQFTKPYDTEAGFTLAEQMVIVAIIGIVTVASAPSIWAMFNRAQVKQTMIEVRTALNETQREAIKGNKVCTVTLNFVDGKITGSCLKTGDRTLDPNVEIATNLTQPNNEAHDQPDTLLVGSDTQPTLGLNDGEHVSQVAIAPGNQTKVSKAGIIVQVITKCKGNTESGLGLGTCKNQNQSDTETVMTDIPIKYGVLGNPEFTVASAASTATDPTGKIIFFDSQDQKAAKRCIAISNTLGLTRLGTYQGDIQPAAITDSGRCTAENWEQQ
ncbi:MAG: type II secretion system protein [Acaryochloridaceae cyanobacterium CSU_3_4]|nr:type II secretion system protein [Acaryochloridaceae cyanobacterium CSU_3_4]